MLIPRSILNLTGAASKDETRLNLNAVYFERMSNGRCRATATDGHELVTAVWDEPESLEMRVPGFCSLIAVADLERAAKIAPKSRVYRTDADCARFPDHWVLDGETMAITDDKNVLTVPIHPLTGLEFPDYTQVLPKNRENHIVGLDPALVTRVMSLVDKMTPKSSRKRGVKVAIAAGIEKDWDNKETPNAAVMPVHVTRTDPDTGIELEALIMPMRL